PARPPSAGIFEDNFNYLSKMCLLRMRQAALRMIELARERSCLTIVAGPDATECAGLSLAGGVDFVINGEGEATLGELLDHLSGRTQAPAQTIAGLSFRPAGADDIVVTPRRPDIADLDALPPPAWDLVDIDRYRDIWITRHGYYSMNMATSRGCPYHCNWCAKPICGQRYNVRSPESVVGELRWLKESYRPDHIWFVDDILGLKPGWIQRFADCVERDSVQTPFKSLGRVDLLLRADTIDALRRAGAEVVWVGAESGSQGILDAMDKGTRVEQAEEATRRLHAAGVRVGFFLQFGYPGETRKDIAATLRLVRTCRPDDIGMSVSYPLPGTKFHKAVSEQLGLKQNWLDSSDLAMMYQGPFSTAFYRQLHVVLHHEFRLRKAWSALRSRGRRLRSLAAVAFHGVALPLARFQLESVARARHPGVRALPRLMTPEAAARPTPQPDAPTRS